MNTLGSRTGISCLRADGSFYSLVGRGISPHEQHDAVSLSDVQELVSSGLRADRETIGDIKQITKG
jgi:hypothetical protein